MEWCAKLAVLERLRTRYDCDWDDPRIRAADLQFAVVDPAASLAAALERAGSVRRVVDDEAVRAAVGRAPADTRAGGRAEFLRAFPDRVWAASWTSLVVDIDATDLLRVSLPDPFHPTAAEVKRALAHSGGGPGDPSSRYWRRWASTSPTSRAPTPGMRASTLIPVRVRSTHERPTPKHPRTTTALRTQGKFSALRANKALEHLGHRPGTLTHAFKHSGGSDMADRIHKEVSHEETPDPEPAPAPAAPSSATQGAQGLDEVLDGIDDVLEVNALTFVQSFRQKGGQ